MNPIIVLENEIVKKLKDAPLEFRGIKVCGYHAGEVADIPRCVVEVTGYELDGTLAKEHIYSANVTCSLVFDSSKLYDFFEIFTHIDRILYHWEALNCDGLQVFGGYLDTSNISEREEKYIERTLTARYFVRAK